MKIGVFVTLFALLATLSYSAHLRNYQQSHQLLGLGNMNPLQIAGLMSGDWVSILPAAIQPIARTILGQEKQSGVAGFLSQAQNLFGGQRAQNGGLFGGMGNLFGQAAQNGQGGLGSLLNNFSGALGGSGGGLSSLLGLPNLNNFNIPGISNMAANYQGGIPTNTGGITGLLNNVIRHQEQN